MSDFENNIQRLFEDYNEKPGNNVWQSIQEYLFLEKIKNQVKEIKVIPSKYLWYRLAFRLQILQFFRFSFKRINFYTILVFIIIFFILSRLVSFNDLFVAKNDRKVKNIKDDIVYYNLRNTVNFNFNFNKFANIRVNENDNITKIKAYKSITETTENKKNLTEISVLNLSGKELYFIENNKPESLLFNKCKLEHLKFITERINFNLSTVINYLTLISFSEADVKLILQNILLYPSIFLGIEKQWYSFSLQTGLNISKYYCNLNYYEKYMGQDQNFIYHLIPNDVYSYSYYQVLNIDSLIANGDTVWITFVDSTYLYTAYDTSITIIGTEKQYYYEVRNKFSFTSFKVPLLLEYYIPFEYLSFGIKGGFSFSYFTFKNLDKKNIQKNLQVALITGVDINLSISNKTTLFSGINYEKALLTKNYSKNYFELVRNNINFVIGIKHLIK